MTARDCPSSPRRSLLVNIYESGSYLLDFSELTYGYVDLRRQATLEPSNVQGSEDILNKMPISALEIKQYVEQNKKIIDTKTYSENFSYVSNLTANDNDWVLSAFDEESRSDGLVYGIGVNHRLKRVDVGFRGTVNLDNWLTDVEAWMTEVENPFYDVQNTQQPKRMWVHHGFYAYMNKSAGSTTKYQEIVEHLQPILKEHPDYKLYVTGHSLGGALASLFAFLVSSEPDDIIPKPVTCISYASPYVGDINFQKAFQFAESTGKIRYLRVTGHKDIVPTIPFVSLFRWKSFAHVGINLMLFDGGRYELSYPKKERLSLGGIIQSLKNAWRTCFLANMNLDFVKYHLLNMYHARFQSAMAQIDTMKLDTLYEDRALVGNLLVAKQ